MQQTPRGIVEVGPEHWEIRVRVKSQRTGEVINRKVRFHGSLDEAVAERLRLVDEAREAGTTEAHAQLTLGGYAPSWLERRRVRGNRAWTVSSKAAMLEQHILPRFGACPLRNLLPTDVEDWLDDCTQAVWLTHTEQQRRGRGERPDPAGERRYAAATINLWLRTLKHLVASAYREFGWGASPVAGVEPLPERRRGEDDPCSLSAELLGRFLARYRQRYPQSWAMAFLGFTTGLRWSELSALRWSDIDEAQGLLHIRRGQVRGVTGETKTEGSRRTLALCPEQLDCLREHRRQLVEAQAPGLAAGLVFPSGAGRYAYHSCMDKRLRRIASDLELPFRVSTKVFRRSFNNLLRQAGVDRQVLRSLTGHSSEEMTGRYSTVEGSEKAAAVGRVVLLASGKPR